MSKAEYLPKEKLKFILDNKDKMRQVDIARYLNVSPACVNQRIKGRRVSLQREGYFNVDEFKKAYLY